MGGHSWEDPGQWLSASFPPEVYLPDPLRARGRASQVCCIGKMAGCVQPLKLLGSFLLLQMEKLRPGGETLPHSLQSVMSRAGACSPFF